MAHLERSVAALRIMGDDLIPDEITRMLGCAPTFGQIKGEKLTGRKASTCRIAKSGMWCLNSVDREPENLDGQIEEILSKLSTSEDIWNGISNRFKVDLFCGLFLGSSNEGLSISPKSLAALGLRGIELDLDIYGSSNEEETLP